MDKIALVTDSSCDLTKEIIQQNNINVLPLRISYSHGEFKDGVDISADEVYANFKKEIPTTSMPSPGDFLATIKKIKSEGYTHCLVVSISSGLSGTYSMMNTVANEIDGIKIHIVDSKLLSRGLGMVTLEAARLIKLGLDFDIIVSKLDSFKKNTKVYFTVDTFEYLQKGGRIGKVAATIGTLLNVKPIISIDEEGKYFTYSKARGKKNALDKMLEPLKKFILTTKANVSILQGMAEDDAQFLYDKIKEFNNIGEICITQITPSLVVHTGPGSVGIVFSPSN
ncbi:DegV family protein [Clostridium cylindrosporum]|uniref:DegV domain-containing protein n=1 Tax=Clostridium cylindrosporum DSM 605 TaxID=1121307 RepID=A0A0J8DB89_CLOCY|nr:DegV family protein [Clostridium cylindrosporum]KMT23102.1 DegV domain-containing protein [Clostridium cylindrosporum DSM 605]